MHHFKRACAVLLTVLLLLGALTPAYAAAAPTQNVPILRIRGENDIIWTAEDGTEHQLYDDGEYISGIVKAALPYALIGAWDKWSEKALEQLLPAYEHYKPDARGVVPADTRTVGRIAPDSVGRRDAYDMRSAYTLWPDQRIAPMDEADYIRQVVEKIKAETGHDKIILIGQCIGNAYLMAYLQKYGEPNGYDGIQSVLFSTTTSDGLPENDALFSGTIDFETETAYRALNKYGFPESIKTMAGGELLQLIYDTLDLVYQSKPTQKLTLAVVNGVYRKVKDSFIAKVLKEYYGRCGAFITSVTDHYEAYKDYVFPTQADKDEYAAQIAKFDDYYYNVCVRQTDILADMQSHGVDVSCVAEYGFQMRTPFGGEETLETGDTRAIVSRESFGCTAAHIGETLPDDYIAEREAAGYGAYISPDRQIDASTGALPDTTWYVKNAAHVFDEIQSLPTAIVRTPGATVQTLAQKGFPQFLYRESDSGRLVPLTAEHTDESEVVTPKTENGFKAFIRWIKTLFRLIKVLLKKEQ